MHYIDINDWNRKSQFNYFKAFDNPFFNVCTELEIQEFYEAIKSKNLSFSLACLYATLKAANETECLRYRLQDDRVAVYDRIDAGNTILNEDETFSFCYFKYDSSFHSFYEIAQHTLQQNHQEQPELDPRSEQKNIIHCSTLPWYRFTSFSHARNYGTEDSIPKFVFGKYFENNGLKLPFSIEVHHALMDGIHVAHFLDRFQWLLNNPHEILG